ncbi:hypothetical protein J6590_079470 [Homalodisca vitripennis]|nr:hypothetical protein J6590_079470 [Homalodisca vitripennis]
MNSFALRVPPRCQGLAVSPTSLPPTNTVLTPREPSGGYDVSQAEQRVVACAFRAFWTEGKSPVLKVKWTHMVKSLTVVYSACVRRLRDSSKALVRQDSGLGAQEARYLGPPATRVQSNNDS